MQEQPQQVLEKAFAAAEQLGIPRMLDPGDSLGSSVADSQQWTCAVQIHPFDLMKSVS